RLDREANFPAGVLLGLEQGGGHHDSDIGSVDPSDSSIGLPRDPQSHVVDEAGETNCAYGRFEVLKEMPRPNNRPMLEPRATDEVLNRVLVSPVRVHRVFRTPSGE